MELRSGRRLRSASTPRPRRSDWISALPDEMLLEILVRLRCARAAALTSGLARRWRGLWRHLPELSFREISPDALGAALDQVACPALSCLEIDIPEKYRIMDPARVLALLRAAARLSPADLIFNVRGHAKDRNVPIEIPCFERATSVKLDVDNLYLTPPAGAVEFPVLEVLYVAGCRFDMVEMIQRCPHLRVLDVRYCWGFNIEVHSPTIEVLAVDTYGWGLVESIDVMAPVLKTFELYTHIHKDCSMSFSAPMAEYISWDCKYGFENVGIGEIWRLREVRLWTEDNISILRLSIHTSDEDGCPPNCLCDQPQNWRSETIPLIALEEVEIEGFGGTDHEVDFLILLFRCATRMKRQSVRLGPEVSPSDGGCKKLYCILKENPDVKCSVYRSCGEQVMCA